MWRRDIAAFGGTYPVAAWREIATLANVKEGANWRPPRKPRPKTPRERRSLGVTRHREKSHVVVIQTSERDRTAHPRLEFGGDERPQLLELGHIDHALEIMTAPQALPSLHTCSVCPHDIQDPQWDLWEYPGRSVIASHSPNK